ncbi:proteasome subunit beta type-5 [Macrosteles quadrilineatus]|uniref:proteasome subunit beta type-5 n=1 Tax=Macrosteles quadrilineatus TaxID=74068 RepID=UPI0023E0D25E|nr:proteasome subunit beta type-5 [Macrosteles quadrilineatus]
MALDLICGMDRFFPEKQGRGTKDDIHFDISGGANFINHTVLALPPFGEPEKLSDFIVGPDGKKLRIDFEHGTTTLGFMYQGGIVLAVDSRATGGSYIASQSMKKVVEINDYLLGTIAGGAADCVYWDRVLTKQCRMYELRNRERISVAAASKLMTNMIYNYKGMGLSIGMMIAGWDKRGPGLYYVDSEGTRTPGKVFSAGSGSTYALGVLDSGYRWDLSDDEAYELGRRSIYHATFRDSYSGGIVRVYHMKATGWVHISDEDCKDLHYAYADKK